MNTEVVINGFLVVANGSQDLLALRIALRSLAQRTKLVPFPTTRQPIVATLALAPPIGAEPV